MAQSGLKDRLLKQIGAASMVGADRLAQTVESELVFTSTWNGAQPLTLGAFNLWVDASGRLRIKSSAPASDTDGAVVGTQA